MENDSANQPLTGSKLAISTVSLALAVFMNVLDTTITNVSIPTIAGNLSVSPSQGTWTITSYSVAMAIVVPLTGWLARYFGEVRLFVACTALFSMASLACGLAPDFTSLIILRSIQGLVAGPMIPLSQSLLLRCYPPEKKGMALAFWAMTTVVAPILGPILGGYITDNIGWPWIFYINIPIGLTSSFVTWQMLKKRESKTSRNPIDVTGLILLVVGVGCLQIFLDRGHELDWFNSTEVTLLAIVAVISLSLFLAWELFEKHPVVDLSLFLLRNYTVGTLAVALGYMTFFSGVVIFPLWLQTQMGYTATWAGLAAAPIGMLTLMLTPIVGASLHKVDVRVLSSFSFFVFAFTCFWQAGFNTDATFYDVALPRLAQGIAMSCFFVPVTSISLSGLTPDRIAAAAGLTNFMRILGGSFGTSISVTFWDDRAIYHRSVLVESISQSNPYAMAPLEVAQSNGMSYEGALAVFERIIGKQAATLATNDIFLLSGVIFSCLILFIWLSRGPFMVARN
ncbi:MAG: DHA2 family efflux MFS transporter permease subunit [Nitrospinae bacterium]|nr:DHA2 family efflux MFS transporter permease subunit [Nitrospinota bacterium]